jgi:hypothetical protein
MWGSHRVEGGGGGETESGLKVQSTQKVMREDEAKASEGETALA